MSFVEPKYRIRARDFSRGFADTPEDDTIHPGSTPDARNAFFTRIQLNVAEGTRRALMSKRLGCRLVNPTPIASAKKIDALIEFAREGAATELLASCDGALSKYDGTSSFSALVGGTGFTAGRTTRAAFQKNQAYLVDGDKNLLYDGTSCRTPGVAKPTGVTNMTAVAPTGAGTTGTYVAVYTWYDQTHDHDSSITGETAALVTAAQARRHTKPAGAPPAHVTHWRAWVKRTDTSESYYFLAATVAIGTVNANEEVSDLLRVTRSPTPTSNDPPPTFDLVGIRYGHALGFKKDSSDMYVSKQGDVESFDPSDIISIGKGDGKPVRAVIKFGEETIVQKPHKSFRLTSTKMPFLVEDLHSAYGAVSPEAGVEVDGKLYQWDEVRGPYVTDLVNWQSLGDNRIAVILGTVNRNSLSDIRCVHDEANNLVIWAIPTGTSTRKRTLLPYNYLLNAWLPPITGFEYGSLVQFTDANGLLAVYFGDYWGRVYQMFSGHRDGPPSGTVRATVTGATGSTVTAAAALFYTIGAGLAGMPVAVRSPSGIWQWRRIQSNTGQQITLDTTNANPWTTTPDPSTGTWTVVVGGIEYFWWTPSLDFGAPEIMKRGHWLELQAKSTSSDVALEVHGRFNDDDAVTSARDYSFAAGTPGAVWGVGIWGASLWGTTHRQTRKKRIGRTFFSMQLQFRNYFADQPVDITLYQVGADPLPRRRSTSGR